MGEFRMPSLGPDMEAGTLIEWKVKPGDRVHRGDIIGEVLTDKGDIDVEVFEDGVVDEILIQPGEKVPVGAVLATIREDRDEEAPETDRGGRPVRSAEPFEAPRRIRSSPLARRIAADHHINLSDVRGTGPGGAVQRADVERYAAEQAVAKGPAPEPRAEEEPAAETREELAAAAPEAPVARPAATRADAMRRAVAAAMSRSNRDIPHYYLETRIDMSCCLEWLEAENERRSVKERLLPVVPLVKAVALALNDVPELNGYWKDDDLVLMEAVHVGFTVSLRSGGVVVPAIHHADSRTLDELMADLTDVILRAREGNLRSSDLTDATITVTSLGDRGVETVYGVIYPPQVALVGFGRITEQPWAEDGMLDVRPVVTATLAADHRATDGRTGARFLESVTRRLQNPVSL